MDNLNGHGNYQLHAGVERTVQTYRPCIVRWDRHRDFSIVKLQIVCSSNPAGANVRRGAHLEPVIVGDVTRSEYIDLSGLER